MDEKATEMMRANATRLAKLKKWQRAWEALLKEQSEEKPDAGMLKYHVDQLAGWAAVFPGHETDWKAMESRIIGDYLDMLRHFENDLRQICKQHGYTVEGEYPTLAVDGLIRVQIDKERSLGTVNGKKTILSVMAVMDAVGSEHRRLWERPFEHREFLRVLGSGYREACQHKELPAGEYVPLRDVYQVLRVADAKYSADMFAADLSRLIEVSAFREDQSVDLAPVRDPKNAFYIYDRKARNGRYLGLVRFRKGHSA